MGKSMAVIRDGVVENIIWCSIDMEETDELKNIYDSMVQIGDEYSNGLFYRGGELVLTEIGIYQRDLSVAYEALNILGVFSA